MTTRIDAMTGARYQACRNSGCFTSGPYQVNASGFCSACGPEIEDIDAWAHDWRMGQLDEQQDRSHGYPED